MVFKKYAQYYDAIYKEKEYKEETDFLVNVIKKFSKTKVKNILSLGCGTASHDIVLAQRGFSITGIDGSKEMIDIAKEKAKAAKVNMNFKVADITKFRSAKKYDFAMAMFNIAGYMADNKSMEAFLKNAAASLKKGGLLVFDCWYGPAVLKDRPGTRTKDFDYQGKKVTRKTTQETDIEKSVINIHFEILENNKTVAKETHTMRFWFLNELEYFLNQNGFELVKTSNFLDLHSKISEDAWNIFVIAKKK